MILREPPIPLEVNAYVQGDVVEVLPAEGVVVETRGSFVQGIFGIGGETQGTLRMAVASPEEPLTEAAIVLDAKGTILVGGSQVSRQVIERAVAGQSEDISYGAAAVGGALGGAIGAAVWWGFTAATKVGFGLVAVVIGFAVGKGVTSLAGGKRSIGLQILSTGIAAVSFVYATYLVNRTFIERAFAEEGQAIALPLAPNLELLAQVVAAGFEAFDVVFLGIVLWQAWKMPAPVRLG